MTRVSERELFAITEVLRSLADAGVKVDDKLTTDQLLGLAAKMLSYVLGKKMTLPELKRKINAGLALGGGKIA
jgi:hypothetical protein